jgi:hypothetical protein
MGRWGLGALTGMVLALSGSVAAQEPDPFATGWYLDQSETGGVTDMFLYWFDAEVGLPTFQINCQKGFPDVVIATFTEQPEGGDPDLVAMVGGVQRHEMAAISGAPSGRYSTDGITMFTPELMEILVGQFTVEADGVEIGRYSAKGAAEKFAKMFAGCPAG